MFDAILALVLAQLGIPTAHEATPADTCAGISNRAGGAQVTATDYVAPGSEIAVDSDTFYRALPVSVPFCRVEGTIEGSIEFEVWLPQTWNGRLLGAGVGGDAGMFNYTDMSLRVEQGFATVTTDTGHKRTDDHWMLDASARENYEHRAVHLATQAAKKFARAFYGREVDRSYFTGCSGGGRQALKEMQNYPEDYDGVIAGAPAPYMPLQSVRMLWFSLRQQANPEAAVREQDWEFYERSVVAACDGNDAVLDGIVENPASCHFDSSKLACTAGDDGACIPEKRLAMLQEIVSPMDDGLGNAMDRGLFPGVRTRPGPPSPLLRAMWADGVHQNPDWDEMTFDRVKDLALVNRVMPELRADKTAIAPFLARGGKAIIYQGWQDPSTNAGPAIDYYAKLARLHGGAEELSRSVRLFMVPGMYHCGRGPGVDLFGGSTHRPLANGADPSRDILWSLIRWVEQGRQPASLVGAKNPDSAPGFTRLLCPFPQVAHYDGKGPTADASSFSCTTDSTLAAMFD